jgi:peptidoglycan hydrolase-like protein with peptidoglycan-binding domain
LYSTRNYKKLNKTIINMKKVYAISALVLLGVVTGNVAHAQMPLTADVKVGATGEKVMMLQDFLRAEGHFTLASTGYFGPVTTAALKSYQAAHGLPATGVLDTETLAAMQTEDASGEAVVEAAMERHPAKVPQILEAVGNILKDLDPAKEEAQAKIAQLTWLLGALMGK